MATSFEFKQGYGLFHADFARPAFDLFGPTPQKLLEQLLAHLSEPYGARIGGLKVDNADGALGRAHVSCPLLDFAVTLRVGLERLELESFQLERVGVERLSKLAVDGVRALVAARGDDPFATYTLDLGLHGVPRGLALQAFLGRFLAIQPKHRAPLLGSGCTLYFGAIEEQLSSSITVDMSAVVKDGLFVRSRTVWDASRASIEALPDLSAAQLNVALAQLDLTGERQ